jgi:hypothetical protein
MHTHEEKSERKALASGLCLAAPFTGEFREGQRLSFVPALKGVS